MKISRRTPTDLSSRSQDLYIPQSLISRSNLRYNSLEKSDSFIETKVRRINIGLSWVAKALLQVKRKGVDKDLLPLINGLCKLISFRFPITILENPVHYFRCFCQDSPFLLKYCSCLSFSFEKLRIWTRKGLGDRGAFLSSQSSNISFIFNLAIINLSLF